MNRGYDRGDSFIIILILIPFAYIFFGIKSLIKNLKTHDIVRILTSLLSAVAGIISVVTIFIDTTVYFSSCFILFGLLIIGFILYPMYLRSKYKIAVSAKLVAIGGGSDGRYFKFNMYFDGKEQITTCTKELTSATSILKNYELSRTYDIYINPDAPEKCVFNKNLGIVDIIILLVGIFFVLLPFILYNLG